MAKDDVRVEILHVRVTVAVTLTACCVAVAAQLGLARRGNRCGGQLWISVTEPMTRLASFKLCATDSRPRDTVGKRLD
jgi:hypothetical protein